MHIFNHLHTISLQGDVWQEQIDVAGARSYISAPQPACPPTQASLATVDKLKIGISLMEFNDEGDLVATRSDSIPSTVWIWSIKTSSALAVIMHHSPVKKVQWHPKISDLLLMHCTVNEPVVHLWRATWDLPQVIHLHLNRMGGKMEAVWLRGDIDDAPMVMLSSMQNYMTAQIMSNGQGILQPLKAQSFGVGPEDMFDEGNSFDLSPVRTRLAEAPADGIEDSLSHEQSGSLNLSDEIDDTFHYKRIEKGMM